MTACVLILSVVWKVEMALMMVDCVEHMRETERTKKHARDSLSSVGQTDRQTDTHTQLLYSYATP